MKADLDANKRDVEALMARVDGGGKADCPSAAIT